MFRHLLIGGCAPFFLIAASPAVRTDAPAELKTYTVKCKVVRKMLISGSGDKPSLETIESAVPDLTTLEDTRAEYFSGGGSAATPYGFRLRARARTAPGGKVRLEVTAEDTAIASGGFNPATSTHRQQVIRQLGLGKMLRLELNKTPRGEGTWVELTVEEARDDR